MRGNQNAKKSLRDFFHVALLALVIGLFGVGCSGEDLGTIDSQAGPSGVEESEDNDPIVLDPDELERAELDELRYACDDDHDRDDDIYEDHAGVDRVDLDNIESSSIVVDRVRIHGDFGMGDEETPMEFRVEDRTLDLLALSGGVQLLIDDAVVDPLSVTDISKVRLYVKQARVKPISENEIDLTIPSEMLRIHFDDDVDTLEGVDIDVSGHFKRLPTGEMQFVPPVICVDDDDDHHHHRRHDDDDDGHSGLGFFERLFR